MSKRKLYINSGVGRRLFIAFLVVSLFSFASAMVGWFGLGFVRNAQNTVLEEVYPAERNAQQIALEANVFVLGLRTLSNALTLKELEREKNKLELNEARLLALFSEAETSIHAGKVRDEVRPNIQKLSDIFRTLTKLSREKINLEKNIQGEQSALVEIIDRLIDFSKDELIKHGGNTLELSEKIQNAIQQNSLPAVSRYFDRFLFDEWNLIEEFSNIQFRAKTIRQNLISVTDADSIQRVQDLKQNITRDLRAITIALARINTIETQEGIAKEVSRFSKAILKPDSFFDSKVRSINNGIENRNIRNSANETGETVQLVVSNFAEDIQRIMENKSSSVKKRTYDTQILLAAIALFSLVASIVIYIAYINNNIMHRLQRLYTATVNINNGDLSSGVDISGDDQITDLERAINNFRFNSIQLQQVESQLKIRADDLERSNKDLEQFAYVTSHDLRAPLRGLTSLTQWIEEDIAAGNMEEVAENLLRFRARVSRMDALLNGILLYSRVGHEKEKSVSLEVKPTIEDIFNDINADGPFNLDMVSDLQTITTKGAFFKQVVANLISNAIKHHDKETGVVSVNLSKKGSNYRLIVADDGPGIPEQMRGRVFKIFQTLKPKDEVEASGIGLSLVKRLVDRHKGKVTITSSNAGGAEFKVIWPSKME